MRPTARPRCGARPAPPRRADPPHRGLGHPERSDRGGGEHQRGEEHGRGGLDEQEQTTGDADREPGEARDQLELRVGLDQTGVAVDDHRHDGRLGHRVGLRHDEHQERLGEQPQAVGADARHHQDADEDAADARPDEDHAVPAPGTVHGRADQRTDHGEGRHREHEVEEDLPAGPGGIDVEEQRSGQGHRDERVAPERQRVGQGEAAERGRRRDADRRAGPPQRGLTDAVRRAVRPGRSTTRLTTIGRSSDPYVTASCYESPTTARARGHRDDLGPVPVPCPARLSAWTRRTCTRGPGS